MVRNLRLALSLLVLGAICTSLINCKSDDPEPSVANVIGSVTLYDDGVNLLPPDGMTVTVENTDPKLTAVTGTNGSFIIENVPLGSINLSYQKQDYGTFKVFNIPHQTSGTGTILTIDPTLGKQSTTAINVVTSEVVGSNVRLTVETDPPANSSNFRFIRIFLSNASNVSSENYSAVLETRQIGSTQVTLSSSELSDLGFISGQTVFIAIYGESFYSNDYEDPSVGRRIFPNLNVTSTSTSFTMP